MNKNKDIKKILKETFSKSKIPNNISKLKMGDIKEWDSLGNFNLLLTIEREFKIRFSMKEISEIKSIKSLEQNLKKR
jgi:acyl carrier protein